MSLVHLQELDSLTQCFQSHFQNNTQFTIHYQKSNHLKTQRLQPHPKKCANLWFRSLEQFFESLLIKLLIWQTTLILNTPPTISLLRNHKQTKSKKTSVVNDKITFHIILKAIKISINLVSTTLKGSKFNLWTLLRTIRRKNLNALHHPKVKLTTFCSLQGLKATAKRACTKLIMINRNLGTCKGILKPTKLTLITDLQSKLTLITRPFLWRS